MSKTNITFLQKNCKYNRTTFFNVFGYIISVLLFAIIILLIINPAKYMASVLAGINLFFYSILPSMFPFFFLSNLLTEFKLVHKISRGLEGFMQRVFRVPGITSYVFLMSVLCGYPVGAKLIADFYDKGLITSKQANKMLPLSSTSGPIFVIGAVGAGLLLDAKIGALIFVSHIIATILTALLFRGKRTKEDKNTERLPLNKSTDNILKESINSSVTSILAVGAYVSIFYMFIDMAYDIGLLSVTQKLIGGLLKILNIDPRFSQGIASGLFEMTRGCREIGMIDNKLFHLIFCTFLISLSGISILMQSLSFLANTKIKTHTFLLVKCVQSIISIVVALVVGLLFL